MYQHEKSGAVEESHRQLGTVAMRSCDMAQHFSCAVGYASHAPSVMGMA